MKTYKILVTGPFDSGKSQFINTVSDIETASTEVKIKDENGQISSSTAAMDFGQITLADNTLLNLFGTPGQEHLGFMCDILSEGMNGLLLIVDSSRESTLDESRRFIRDLYVNNIPMIIAANKQDAGNKLSPHEIKEYLALGDQIPVLPCIATNKHSVVPILDFMSEMIRSGQN